MNFAQFLSPECICLDMKTGPLVSLDEEEPSPRMKKQHIEAVVKEIAQVLYNSGKIQNLSKLTNELIYRERKSSSGIGLEVALPHLRCLQTKSFIMGFARSHEGLYFNSIDEEPVKIFIAMAAPPYDDKHYLKIYKLLSKAFLETDAKEQLLEAHSPSQVIRIFNQIFR